jgi:TolB-like protein/DNA-binding winged helix-turn-helix (wHTH) protein/Flp pilus assembly protein TadD
VRDAKGVLDSTGVVEFGSFQLNSTERRLARDGEEVALTPRAFDVLVVLVSHAGQLVKRDQLLSNVWREAFVEEANLNYTVSLLRKALGDSPDVPTYIETISKHGYRFIAPVRAVEHTSPVSPSSQAFGVGVQPEPADDVALASSPDHGWQRPDLLIGAAVIALVAAVVGGQSPALRERLADGLKGSSAPPIRSVAVLPLTDLSGAANEEWFADGMTDALITELSRVSGLRIIARNSTMPYRKTEKSLSVLAGELHVDGILAGTVLREGDRVRIAVQLYHAPTDAILLSVSYQKELRSILALHAEIALDVTRRIRVRVAPDEESRLTRARPVERETYEALLRARAKAATFTLKGLEAAMEEYHLALARSPNDATALAELARTTWVHASFFEQAATSATLAEARASAMALAERAVRLDDTLAAAHATLGWFRFWTLDWAAAERAFLRAIDLDASNPYARHGYAFYLTTMARFEEAIVQMRYARELDPRSPLFAIAAHWPFYCARRYDDAASELSEARVMEPHNPTVLLFLGNVRSLQGRHDEALAELKHAGGLGAAGSMRLLAFLAAAHARAGRIRDAEATLAELRSRGRDQSANPMWVARAHAAAGQGDEALAWLEQAYETLVMDLTTIQDPVWDGVRAHPRFVVVLKKMGLPQ